MLREALEVGAALREEGVFGLGASTGLPDGKEVFVGVGGLAEERGLLRKREIEENCFQRGVVVGRLQPAASDQLFPVETGDEALEFLEALEQLVRAGLG